VQLQYLRQCNATPRAPLGELTALPQTSGFRERKGKGKGKGGKGKGEEERKGKEKETKGENGEKEKGTKGRKEGGRERGKGEGKGRNFVQLRFFGKTLPRSSSVAVGHI